MARPSNVTDQLIEKFCLNLRVTGSIETAIALTRIGRESFYRCKRRVRQGIGTEMERRFMSAVDQSEGEVKLRREYQLGQHAETSWRSIAWWLERKYPQEYGLRRVKAALEDPENALPPDPFVWEGKPTIRIQPALAAAKSVEGPGAGHFEAIEAVSGAWIDGAFYEKLGLKPLTGRLLTISDDRLDAPLVGVLTDDYWARRFGRDLTVIGRIMRIEGVPVTVVGVSPPEFTNGPNGQIADLTMAMGVKARVPAGNGRRSIVWN
jgi:hypothetical protein